MSESAGRPYPTDSQSQPPTPHWLSEPAGHRLPTDCQSRQPSPPWLSEPAALFPSIIQAAEVGLILEKGQKYHDTLFQTHSIVLIKGM